MTKARKAVGEKVILDDVTMSFYPGAKIGVVGPNGAGKSTILKIMAGMDQPSNGEARIAPGASVGILLQEPPLNEEKTVLGNVEEGAGEIKAKLDRYNADLRGDGRAGRRLRRAAGGDGQAPGGDRPRRRVGPRRPARAGDGRAALPAAGRRRHRPVRWRAPPGGPVQAAPAEARPAPARRADQPPRRRVGAVAGAAPGRIPGCRPGRDPRPVLPRQRRRVDRRGRPRPALPLPGQLLDLPGEEVRTAAGAGQEGRQAAEAPQGRARVGAVQPQGPPGEVQGAPRALRGDGGRGRPHPEAGLRGDPDPAGPAAGVDGHRGQGPQEGLRRADPHRRPLVLVAAQRDRRGHRPQRGRQDHPVQDHRRVRGAGRRRREDRRDGEDLLRRPGPLRARPQEEPLGDGLRRSGLPQGRQRRDPLPRLRLAVRVQGPGPAEGDGGPLRRRAQPAQPRAHPQAGRQPAPARRADQRPRRRDARLTGERAARVPRAAPW